MPSYDIQIRVEAKSPRVSARRIQKNAGTVLKALGWKKAGLSLLLVDDRAIRRANKKYLRHDYATDVIAFSHLEGKPLRGKSEQTFLGDILVSIETAARQAAEFGNSFEEELHFYICHGILHLMGWDDHSPKERKRMFAKQNALLKKIWPSRKPKQLS